MFALLQLEKLHLVKRFFHTAFSFPNYLANPKNSRSCRLFLILQDQLSQNENHFESFLNFLANPKNTRSFLRLFLSSIMDLVGKVVTERDSFWVKETKCSIIISSAPADLVPFQWSGFADGHQCRRIDHITKEQDRDEDYPEKRFQSQTRKLRKDDGFWTKNNSFINLF